MKIKRRTALCLAITAAWKVFFGTYRLAHKTNVQVKDTMQITYTINVTPWYGGKWWRCHQT